MVVQGILVECVELFEVVMYGFWLCVEFCVVFVVCFVEVFGVG